MDLATLAPLNEVLEIMRITMRTPHSSSYPTGRMTHEIFIPPWGKEDSAPNSPTARTDMQNVCKCATLQVEYYLACCGNREYQQTSYSQLLEEVSVSQKACGGKDQGDYKNLVNIEQHLPCSAGSEQFTHNIQIWDGHSCISEMSNAPGKLVYICWPIGHIILPWQQVSEAPVTSTQCCHLANPLVPLFLYTALKQQQKCPEAVGKFFSYTFRWLAPSHISREEGCVTAVTIHLTYLSTSINTEKVVNNITFLGYPWTQLNYIPFIYDQIITTTAHFIL